MGYGIVIIMKKSFKDSDSFEGRVAFAKEFERLTNDIINVPQGGSLHESFAKDDDWVSVQANGYYYVNFYPNLIRVRTPEQWGTFCSWDAEPGSPRAAFQRILDRIQPEECWIGSEYANVRVDGKEVSLEGWLESIRKEFEPVEDFDFERIYEDYKRDVFPQALYRVKNNNLY